MRIRKILWPTDLSAKAGSALPMVNSLAAKYSAEVHVIFVLETSGNFGAWYGELDPAEMEKIHNYDLAQARAQLDRLCQASLEGCPLYIRHIAAGDPALEILATIENEGIELVVMASHGNGGGFMIGRVAERVLRSSLVPVVLVPTA